MPRTSIAAALLLCAALAAYSVPASAQGPLGMAELKALISGKTVHFEEIATGRAGRAYHAASGQIEVLRDDGGTFAGLLTRQ